MPMNRTQPLAIDLSILICLFGVLLCLPLIEWFLDLETKFIVAGLAVAGGALITLAVQRDLERGLFLLLILSLSVRATANLGPPHPSIASLWEYSWPSWNPGWIGITLGVAAVNIFDIPLFCLLLLLLINPCRQRQRFPVRLLAGGLGFVGAGFLSMANAAVPALSFWGLMESIKAVLIGFYVVYRTRTKEDLAFAVNAISVAMVLQSLVVIAQFFTKSSLGVTFSGIDWADLVPGTEYIRASGTFAHPQMLAMYVSLFAPLMFTLLFAELGIWARIKRSIVFLLCCVTIIFTFARMSWFALFMVVSFIANYLQKFARLPVTRWLKLSFAVAIIIVVSSPLFEVVRENITLERPGSELDIIAALYDPAFNMILRHPFIGVGFNNYSYVVNEYDNVGIAEIYPAPVHNSLLLAFSETGILGFASFFLMITIPIYVLVKSMKSSDLEIKRYAVGLLGGLISFCFLIMTSWTYYLIQSQTWLLFGLALSMHRFIVEPNATKV